MTDIMPNGPKGRPSRREIQDTGPHRDWGQGESARDGRELRVAEKLPELVPQRQKGKWGARRDTIPNFSHLPPGIMRKDQGEEETPRSKVAAPTIHA